MNLQERLAGAPISWGVCEVPGWGEWPAPQDVLAEMASLGLRGTELGAPGFLPADPSQLTSLLADHGLALAGAFVPLVLHERSLDQAVGAALAAARMLGAAGGETLVVVAVQDLAWSRPAALDRDGWRRLGQHLRAIEETVGELEVRAALHPHFATLIETREDIERTLDVSPDIGWCLDTGHMLIGGADPAQFVSQNGERVVHVHLKDVDSARARELTAGAASLQRATRNGLFAALGEGDAPLSAVLEGLERHGYDGWLVLEQDTAITADGPAAGGGPVDDARASIEFLQNFARQTPA